MIYFNNDYSEGCHPRVLEKLTETNLEQTPGYGEDGYCARAARRIQELTRCPGAAVHFLVGGTQTNLTVIAAALRPYQGVLAADTAHIACHETGAIEATGHKVLCLPGTNGKITGAQVARAVREHRANPAFQHMPQPGMVYISQPTELGTLYTLRELEELAAACREYGLPLFADGARLGYGLEAAGNDVTLPDLARLCDVFYIGGTKVGALFGEAVVIPNPELQTDFRYLIKQRGGMLAKGRLLGVQFCALLEDGLYFEISRHGDRMADRIRRTLAQLGIPQLAENTTNQIFPILPDAFLDSLAEKYVFCEQERVDPTHRAVRFCTGWATREADTEALCRDLVRISREMDYS